MIKATLTGHVPVQKRLSKIAKSLAQPRTGLEKATNKVAGVFEDNYDSEGGHVPGGWPELSELTLAMREYQGYPDGPILVRYGALRAVAVEFFKDAKAGQAITHGDDYSDNVVAGSLQVSNKVATLHMGGSYKVLNQMGHDNARWGPNPARPFWFVDRATVAAASEGIRDWIEDEVLAR